MSIGAADGSLAHGDWNWAFGRKVGDWTLALVVFLGAFVIAEPAPYELFLSPVLVIWAVFGFRLNRYLLPLIVLLAIYIAGGFLALTQKAEPVSQLLYVVVTFFLALSAIFFAAIISEAPERRLRIIRRAYIASAFVAALLAVLGYFHLIPGSDAFLLYDRAKGPFQDPNVFAPYLVLPIVLLYRDILTEPLHRSWWKAAILLLLLLGIFLAFSRAAWGMTVFAGLMITVVSYITSSRGTPRLRIVSLFAAGVFVVALMVMVALTVPDINQLFVDRGTTLLEDYDAGPYGRFGRHLQGLYLIVQHPLGLGPFSFAYLLGGDEHNMWIKGFTTYGWIGGFAYIALAIWTLVAATPLIFKPRPWQAIIQCTYVVFVGHLLIHNVIDNDHWRHVFLIYGMLWGGIAAEKLAVRSERLRATTLVPAAHGRLPEMSRPA
ncbi:MAG: hypothetical protein KDJ86_04045 [Bauldia sp.]|uniref:O-antigen ligase family protein n=1 Tax=Bauldia sp. TaxID=2575872 RepID=UPI001E16ADBE|nr:hypothetical protein [Bauldia sp.]MCB1494935.1 hypothetical protein [Bauldia sp.]